MFMKRTFTDEENAKRFIKRKKAEKKIATMRPIKYVRKLSPTEWVDRIKYEVEYEK